MERRIKGISIAYVSIIGFENHLTSNLLEILKVGNAENEIYR